MSQQRRTFLKSLGFAGVGLTLDVSLLAAEPKTAAPAAPKGQDISAVSLSGRVHAQGQGLAGVPVSDGRNVTLTDARGNYTLQSNATAEFVYLSVPRGYAFPHEKGIAQFYKRIKPANGRFKADFELKRLRQDDTKHHFIVWADPQMISRADAEEFKTKSVPDTKQLIDSYGPDALFHGIGCGDLVWDHFELFDEYKQGVATTGIPFFQVIGNHDMDIKARTDEGSSQTFRSLFGPAYYSFNRGNIHYVVLDDVFFIGAAKRYIGYLTEQQLQWLEQDLSYLKPGATVVVALHIPADSGNKRRNKLAEEPLGSVVANRAELYRILKPYKAHLMSGHTHVSEKVFNENTIEHTHGAVCGAWWTGPVCTDGTPSGYAVYEVSGGDIRWYYKSVGRERSHQFRIYPKGSVPERPDEIVVNAWNWDPEWKVTWFENGVSQGAMQQETALDPLAVQLYAGAQLPAKHKFVDPTLTDHLFFAKPSAGAKEIRVEVTDRFGQVYREAISV